MSFNIRNSVVFPTGTSKILNQQAVLESVDYIGDPIDVQLLEGLSLQFIWDGVDDITGILTLEASNNCETFDPIECTPVDITGTSGSHTYNIWRMEYRFLRVRIALSVGDSVFDIWANTRKINNQ